ncbi:MAG: UDP-N-acetylmuramoyl-tripeptide--D-alanyl-D-alanine ligase, partial [Treponema sp.]|nr:UDP-N-acetylmuramoyl-tripeptide--D-alanyl-D-alanine ligase [Treponema sp.]
MSGESLLSLEDVLDSTGGVHVLGTGEFSFGSVQTDSRNVVKGTLFVPLIGEVQDGHAYIPQALEKGASVVFICMANYEKDSHFFTELSQKYPDVYFIAVENTLHALQAAAGRYVEKFPNLIRVGVTGSSGKTTTKEILAAILSRKYNLVCNEGNLNSETGLPLSVFKIRKEHELGLFEMGMNREGEMGEIAAVLKPRFAVITNIGTAHIGNLGSRENIAAEKARIFEHFHSFGTAVIPREDDFASFLENQV